MSLSARLLVLFFICILSVGCSTAAEQTANLSGIYKSKDGPNQGELLLRKIKGNEYQFALYASWTGANPGQVNIGQATSKITVTSNKATYKPKDEEESYELTFDFSKPKQVKIDCQPAEAFGGQNVNANGLYKQTSNVAPDESEFEPTD